MSLLDRILRAAVAGGFAFLVCVLFGGLLALVNIPLVQFLGHFLEQYATAIAILFAALGFIGGVPAITFWRRA